MSTTQADTDRQQSFAETAMRLGGKSEEEARRMGAVDRADEQVEHMFAPQYQTVNSPVHQAVWEKRGAARAVRAAAPAGVGPVRRGHGASLEVVRRHREAGTLFDEHNKVSPTVARRPGRGRLLGHADRSEVRRPGAPFQRFTRFLTRMATHDAMVPAWRRSTAASAPSIRCGPSATPSRRPASCRSLASGESLSGFALTEPCAGSDLTALRTTAPSSSAIITRSPARSCSSPTSIPGRTIGLVVMIDEQAGRADRRSAAARRTSSSRW